MARETVVPILNAIGLLAGVLAAGFLYWGSQGTPWAIQSWSGRSEAEQRFHRRRRRLATSGFALLGFGFLCQFVAELL